jgi:AcrR family transcriptional regulator
MAEPGLRERKKAATRALIIATADRLFDEHGFEGVTLERVAAECEVSVRTVLRYFDTKESLALAHELDMLESFRRAVEERDDDVLSCWRDHVEVSAAWFKGRVKWGMRYLARVQSQPTLHARFLRIYKEYEDLLADHLGQEADDPDGIGPRLLAAMLVAGNGAVFRQWMKAGGPFEPDRFLEVVDYAAAMFAGRPLARKTRDANHPRRASPNS